MVAGGGEDEPLLSGDGEDGPPFCLSHPNSSGCGLDGGDGVVVPQDGGHAERPGQVLGDVVVGGKDEPPFAWVHFKMA